MNGAKVRGEVPLGGRETLIAKQIYVITILLLENELANAHLLVPCLIQKTQAHGVGRVAGALGSEAGFAGSMLN